MDITLENRFIALMKQYNNAIYKECWMFAGRDAEVVHDLYQEIVLRLWKGYQKYRPDDKDIYWIYKISLNTAISYKRKKTFAILPLDKTADNLATHEDTTNDELYELINQLDPLDKSIIYLYLEQRSYEEISQITGISATNVGTKIQRIKQKLKRMNDNQ